MTDKAKALIAVTALNEMFAKRYFDLCAVDSVAKMLGVHPNREAMDTLRPLHCVDWSAMPRELREAVPGLIQQAIGDGSQAFRFELAPAQSSSLVLSDGRAVALDPAVETTRRPLLQRWFGK